MKRAWCHPEIISGSEVQSTDQQVLLGWSCARGAILSLFHGWEPRVPHTWKAYSNIMGFDFHESTAWGSHNISVNLFGLWLSPLQAVWDKECESNFQMEGDITTSLTLYTSVFEAVPLILFG